MSTAGNYITINVKSVQSLIAALLRICSSSRFCRGAPTVAPVPDLAEIVPLKVKLAGRLTDLEKQLQTAFDGKGLEKGYEEFRAAQYFFYRYAPDVYEKIPGPTWQQRALGRSA